MTQSKTKYVAAVALLAFACSLVQAETIGIGSDVGVSGETVSVPVTLDGTADATAALLRLDFDPIALSLSSVLPGELVTAAHAIDVHAPELGRLNVAVYASDGAPALASQSGTLLILTFMIGSNAAPGDYPITLTVATPALPASDLTATTGARIDHTVEAGRVSVLAKTSLNAEWVLYE